MRVLFSHPLATVPTPEETYQVSGHEAILSVFPSFVSLSLSLPLPVLHSSNMNSMVHLIHLGFGGYVA